MVQLDFMGSVAVHCEVVVHPQDLANLPLSGPLQHLHISHQSEVSSGPTKLKHETEEMD